MSKEMSKKQLNIRIEEELLEALKVKLAEYGDDTTITDFLKNIIQDEVSLEDYPKKKKQKNTIYQIMDDDSDTNIEICEEYYRFGRKILKYEVINSKIKTYKRGIATQSYVIPKRGCVPDHIVEKEELMIPTYRIATCPRWDVDDDSEDYRSKIYTAIERTLDLTEDQEVLRCLTSSIGEYHIVEAKSLFRGYRIACGKIKEHQISPRILLIHPALWEESKDDFKIDDEIVNITKSDHIFDDKINIIESVMVPRHSVFVLANPEIVGVFLQRKDTTMLNADDPCSFKKAIVAYRTMGVGIINDYSVVKIIIKNGDD